GGLRRRGRGARRAPDPLGVVRRPEEADPGSLRHLLMSTPAKSPIHRRVDDLAESPRQPIRFDPLLLLAVLGLIACSLLVLASATKDDIPGSPHYYVSRQALYAAVGLVLMVVLTRVDYPRLRELKYGLYGTMIGLILLV